MEKLHTCDEIAELYKVKLGTVWSWIRKGTLPAKRIGRLYRISTSDLNEFNKKRQVNAEASGTKQNERSD